VLKTLFKKAATITVVLAIAQVGLLGQEKKVKDQAEYDLFDAVTKEKDLTKKSQLLETWKTKYPDSDYKIERQQMLVQTYQGLNQGEKMYQSAKEMLAMDPGNTFAMVWVTLLTESLKNTAPDRLDFGEKTARSLIASLDKKPAEQTEEQWKVNRVQLELAARRTLVFVAAARKDNDAVEREITTILKINPNNGALSYQLGAALVAQKKPEKQMAAFWHFARAAHYTGENALDEATRKQVLAYFEKIYTSYAGGKEGMAELVERAKSSPFPPNDLEIKSAQQKDIEQENRLRETNPQLALWLGVKKMLVGPEGPGYFESSVKGAALPKLKGKIISHTPALRPKEVLIDMSDDGTPEIRLRIDNPMASKADPGTEIEFEAVPQEFTPDPFLVTMDVEKDKVTGWPAAARTAPPAGTKKGAGKKK